MRIAPFSKSPWLPALLVLVSMAGFSYGQPFNFLFIMTDQQRWDAFNRAKKTILETPNMDRLADEGVMFTNAYTQNPVCIPARGSILSGMTSRNVGTVDGTDWSRTAVPEGVMTFDEVLRLNGYYTEYHGKFHTSHALAQGYSNEPEVNPDIPPVTKGKEKLTEGYRKWLDEFHGIGPTAPRPDQLVDWDSLQPYNPIPLDWNYDDLMAGLIPEEDKPSVGKDWNHVSYGELEIPADATLSAYTAWLGMDALDRMAGINKPFSLTVSYNPPHPPMLVPEPYYSMYPPSKIPVPESIDDDMRHSPYYETWRSSSNIPYRNATSIQDMRSVYYGMVNEIDHWVGEIYAKLEQHGMLDNTLIIFTSDHGEMMGDHGLQGKWVFYEESAHVPFIMRLPPLIPEGTVVDDPVSLLDIFPTLMDYLDIDYTNFIDGKIQPLDGVSLRPYVDGNPPAERDVVVYFKYCCELTSYMIRIGDMKLFLSTELDTRSNGFMNALYDLQTDPNEMNNLLEFSWNSCSNCAACIAEKMRLRMVEWMDEHEPDYADLIENIKIPFDLIGTNGVNWPASCIRNNEDEDWTIQEWVNECRNRGMGPQVDACEDPAPSPPAPMPVSAPTPTMPTTVPADTLYSNGHYLALTGSGPVYDVELTTDANAAAKITFEQHGGSPSQYQMRVELSGSKHCIIRVKLEPDSKECLEEYEDYWVASRWDIALSTLDERTGPLKREAYYLKVLSDATLDYSVGPGLFDWEYGSSGVSPSLPTPMPPSPVEPTPGTVPGNKLYSNGHYLALTGSGSDYTVELTKDADAAAQVTFETHDGSPSQYQIKVALSGTDHCMIRITLDSMECLEKYYKEWTGSRWDNELDGGTGDLKRENHYLKVSGESLIYSVGSGDPWELIRSD